MIGFLEKMIEVITESIVTQGLWQTKVRCHLLYSLVPFHEVSNLALLAMHKITDMSRNSAQCVRLDEISHELALFSAYGNNKSALRM